MNKAAIAAIVALGGAAAGWELLHDRAGARLEQTLTWPASGAIVVVPLTSYPEDFGRRRIFVDPGHGAAGNAGNRSSWCRAEQDFTVALATELAALLERTHHFEARLSREPGALVDYQARVRAAESWGAEAFVSIHSDVRGPPERWSPEPGLVCSRSRAAPGFSVLWSDEAVPSLGARRLALARATAQQLEAIGLPAYRGEDYHRDYSADALVAGVFVDRRAPAERIFVLRRPTMPSIIIETHNALDDREASRWEEKATREAFAAAVAAALIDALGHARPAG